MTSLFRRLAILSVGLIMYHDSFPISLELLVEISAPVSALINFTEILSTDVPLNILYMPPYI